jgi:hypothetical protein
MGASASRERARYQAQHQAQAQAALQQQQAQHVQLHAHPPPPAFPDAYAPPPVYRPPQVQARQARRGPGAGSWAAQLASEEACLGRVRALPAEALAEALACALYTLHPVCAANIKEHPAQPARGAQGPIMDLRGGHHDGPLC